MAGKRQHIHPRFLLRGFASKTVGDQVFTWLCRTDSNPIETNIINVAVERLFYGASGMGTVDDEITKAESTFAPLIDDLLRTTETTTIEGSEIATFVAHLIVRRKRLREMLRESSEFLFHNCSSPDFVDTQKRLS